MEIQALAITNSTLLQLLFAFFASVLCIALLLVKIKTNSTRLSKPVMETSGDKGELVLGNYEIIKLHKPIMETGREKGELVLGN